MTVVVPCRNEGTTIARLLDAIARQDQPPDETIVVDDGSIDDTVARIRDWQAQHPEWNLRVIRIADGPVGAGAAMNAGIRASEPGFILRLDGHSRPSVDYIRRSAEAIAREGAGVVGGTWTVAPGAPTRTARAIAAVVAHPLGSGGVAYRHPAKRDLVERVDTVPFGCFRRQLWTDLGGFDEQLLANQDYDFNYRARRAGHHVVIDHRITSVYEARATLRALARQYYRYGFWKLRMLRKFPPALRWRQLGPIVILPLLAFLVISMAAGSTMAAVLAASYLVIVFAGSLLIAVGLGDALLMFPAMAAMLTVHISWSAGFWVSALTPSTTAAPRGR